MSDDFTLSDDQRGKLFAFTEQVDRIHDNGSFERDNGFSDAALLALALRTASLMGLNQDEISAFFEREFNIDGITEGLLGECLEIAAVIDFEKRLKSLGGGRN